MSTTQSRPATACNRPTYMDRLYSERPLPSVPSAQHSRSPNSSISSGSSSSGELNHTYEHQSRAIHNTNADSFTLLEEDTQDDRLSIRSMRLHFTSRLGVRNVLNRRTYPRGVQETIDMNVPRPSPPQEHTRTRRPSLPKLQTTFSPSSKRRHKHTLSKPLPPVPSPTREELPCQPCYYFAARNCNGYVMGGSHGDACENCAVRQSPCR